MKLFFYSTILIFGLACFNFSAAQVQTEILSNSDVVSMVKSGLGTSLIISKIKDSKGAFDVSAQGLVNLKNAGIDDGIIGAMLEKSRIPRETKPDVSAIADGNQTVINSVPPVSSPADALRLAKTIAIEKSSLNPSRQALEEELLKRDDWKKLNLNIVRYKESADLRVEIGFVPLSVLTHRYVFRVYDNRSGTVIVAGETTSWGSLAKNLAKHIAESLAKTAK